MDAASQTNRRRTFAIISHPDAGKTTITEKLLLFGGAIQQAGAIKAKKVKKYTTSDWMELEKQRGVSVATSVMCFEYQKSVINLLDTPGHADFSEDTYRTLSAVDSVLMVIDSTKGVESRTIKLLEVCRSRKTPVITFMNKLDRDGWSPFDLLDDVEKQLNIKAVPLSWPISMGKNFKGVYNLIKKNLLVFKPNTNAYDGQTIKDIQSSELDNLIGEYDANKLREDIEMIEGVLDPFDKNEYLNGNMTPVFFGSAINNFGVLELLESIISISPPPHSQETLERVIDPSEEKMTAFVFKIHANMDPKHRDRIAFIRVCSGVFTRGMKVKHVRLERNLKIANPITFMAQTRSIIEESYPGDILGVHDTGLFKIGDTLTEGESLNFAGIPNFSPEVFQRVVNLDPIKSKQLNKGLTQLAEEGAVQLYRSVVDNFRLILGAVGPLQFDVVRFRLENEYSAQCKYEMLDIKFAYWVDCEDKKVLDKFILENKDILSYDPDKKLVCLFKGDWAFSHIKEQYPELLFYRTSECNERSAVL